MNKLKQGAFTKLTLTVTFLLIAASLLLGLILVNHSTQALKTLINGRMLDMTGAAAAMLDPDVLMSLNDEDRDSASYKETEDILARFQDNTGLKYICCFKALENGEFVLCADPSAQEDALSRDSLTDMDAFKSAAGGTAAVEEKPCKDDRGSFYSAFSPVFDPQGKVAGIVAADFSAEWYDDQINIHTGAIIFCMIVSVLLILALILLYSNKLKKQITYVTSEIDEITEDIDDLVRMVSPDDTKGPSEDTGNDLKNLRYRIKNLEEDLSLCIHNLHSQENSMITALSSDYRSVYYIDLDKNEGICYQSHSQLDNGLKPGEHFPFGETMNRYASDHITEKYREAFLSFLDPSAIKKGLANERIITFRYMVNRSGQESYEMVKMAGVRHPEDRKDHVVHAIGMGFADVDVETRRTLTQSQALSDALNAAESANKAKTAFLSNMSHEIRTPMNAIIGLDRIALNDPTISESTRSHLEKIGVSAEHLLDIINDILDMSRIEAGRMVLRNEIFSLYNILEQINVLIGGQCRDRSLKWELNLKGEPEEYYIGDDTKLKQVLINILGNAVKFTPEGGSVSFTIERLNHYDKKSVFRFVISDTGIGMDKDFLPRLFDPFSQEDLTTKTKYGSTGLGMSITKSIVEMMNGDIRVESEKNRGTTFTVTVTLSDSEHEINEEDEISPKEMHVLVVDDDPVACKYAQMELEKAGVSTEIALSGAEAVEMVKLKNARRESYNLILMDWNMPDIDGLEVTRQIRTIIGYDSAIVILTSYHWDEIIDKAAEAGIDSFISKPLRAGTVLQQFKQAFALKVKNAKTKVELKGRRILIAEDMAVNAEIIMMMLEMKEIESDHVENGRLAVESFSSKPQGFYDAILMDMRMPEMDGLEATRAIRALERDDAKTIPIIALTANAFDEDVQRSLQAGLNAHLSKPVEPENLYETLESLIKP